MPKAETIASAANPLLKEIRKAIVRGDLTSRGCCVAESLHLLEEALRSGSEVEAVVAAESARAEVEALLRPSDGVRIVAVNDRLFQSIAATETTQGVIALVKPPYWSIEQLFGARPLVLLLDGLQDPGNAGTTVRAAEAFGATGVLFLKGTAGPFHPKTLRASAGSLFRVPFLSGLDRMQARTAAEQNGAALYAAVAPRAGTRPRNPDEVDFRRGCALAIGSEAHGVGAELREGAVEVAIPTRGVESLNAAVAAGILLYEAARQRSKQP